MMRLEQLIAGLPIGESPSDWSGDQDPEHPLRPEVAAVDILGVSHDSRRVEPGDLFVAWAGQRYDGRVFAHQAVHSGAVAVLASGPAPEDVGVPWLLAEDPRSLLGAMAARAYDHPDRELVLVGVTGTNGKSTVTELLGAMLEKAGRPTGTMGTLGYGFRGLSFAAGRTTPEATDLFRNLRRMRSAGADAVVMEVSSHALAQGRVSAAEFDVAVFTNLSRDHFDFHNDYEDYFATKRRLFDQLKTSGRAVVNLEDSYGRRLAAEIGSVVGFGDGGAVTVSRIELDERGIRGRVTTPRGTLDFDSPLLGRYNIENIVAAVAAAEALDLDHAAVVEAIGSVAPLTGRLEPVVAGQPFPIFIDFSHTPAGLEAALRSLRELSDRKIALVFGCGGEKDPGKRPIMGRIAGQLAELPIVTADNPRREDPNEINAAVEQGLKQSGCSAYRIIPDRSEAIRRAIAVAAARENWCVLVAGKGHENMQIIGDEERSFSDRLEIESSVEEILGPTADA